MIKNYIKIAYRNILKQKGYSVINVTGLALGLSCTMILLLFIKSELSYDTFHNDSEQIFRFTMKANVAGRDMEGSTSPIPLKTALETDYHEIVAASRINQSVDQSVFINNQNMALPNFFYADHALLNVFTFTKKKGKLSLENPNDIIISEETAKTYFNGDNPIGQRIELDDSKKTPLTVVGVFKDFPTESHIHPQFIASYKTYWRIRQSHIWLGFNTRTYAKLKSGNTIQEFDKKMPALVEKYMGKQLKQFGAELSIHTQPLEDIHLKSERYQNEFEPQGSMTNIYVMSIIALFLIIIASINFMNLSTARSSKRAKEVGMRKVLGAQKNNLIIQFLGESLFLALISLVVAYSLIELFLPIFNELANRSIEFSYIANIDMVLAFIGITVLVGLLSGLYPAFYLSSFSPITVLKGNLQHSGSAPLIRKSLVVLQFTISITLIIGTLIIIEQLNYMQNKDLGFDKDQTFSVELTSRNSLLNFSSLKNILLQNNSILNMSTATNHPGDGQNNNSVYREEGTTNNDSKLIDQAHVNDDYFETLGMRIAQGRFFSKDFPSDTISSVIINEAAAKKFGYFDNAVGRKIIQPGTNGDPDRNYTIVGVVKDFHNRSLRETIKPMIFKYERWGNTMLMRVSLDNLRETLSYIESEFKKMNPNTAFEYEFIDHMFQKFYDDERNTASIINVFTSLAIFIACLGLFGLASFMADQKIKEIGIRKVLGASIQNIFFIFGKEFGKLVLISIILATPIAYVVMTSWLQNFAYQVDLNILPFIIAGCSGILITMLTISYQAMKAATQNPILALKYE